MADLEIFKSDEFGEVRTTIIEGKAYFCGKDVSRALGYVDTTKAMKQHCKDSGVAFYPLMDLFGRKQDAKFISLSNVIRMIVAASKQSNNQDIKDKAEKYEKWIFEDIMPSIHATGSYSVNDQIREVPNIPIGDLASFLRIERTVMKDNGKTPQEIAQAFKMITDQFLINTPENFTENKYAQLSMF